MNKNLFIESNSNSNIKLIKKVIFDNENNKIVCMLDIKKTK